jgi:hypothetical protein
MQAMLLLVALRRVRRLERVGEAERRRAEIGVAKAGLRDEPHRGRRDRAAEDPIAP